MSNLPIVWRLLAHTKHIQLGILVWTAKRRCNFAFSRWLAFDWIFNGSSKHVHSRFAVKCFVCLKALRQEILTRTYFFFKISLLGYKSHFISRPLRRVPMQLNDATTDLLTNALLCMAIALEWVEVASVFCCLLVYLSGFVMIYWKGFYSQFWIILIFISFIVTKKE